MKIQGRSYKCRSAPALPARILVLILPALGLALGAAADVFEVDRLDDPFPAQACDAGVPGDCSLREAVMNANTTQGPDLILIPAGTYTLTRAGSDEDAAFTGDLDLTDIVRIEGVGEAFTIIDGGGVGGLGDRILDIRTSEVELADLTIRGGSGVYYAGGLYNRSALLIVERSTITGNVATGAAGGIRDVGDGTYIEVTVSDNEAGRAGGVDVGETTNFIDSRIIGNRATSTLFGGGGLFAYGLTSLTRLVRTDVSGNSSALIAGGVDVWGPVEIIDSTIHSNFAADTGGGLAVHTDGTATIDGTTFFGNTAGFLGGAADVLSGGIIEITNSTISGNHASTAAGGIRVDGTATLTHVTISRNTSAVGTAMMNTPNSDITYGNTIIEGSCNAALTVTSLGGNIESPAAGCQLNGTIDQINISTAALNLGPLGYFGGRTPTQVPLPGSAAVDLANGCPSSMLDQRGITRPVDGDGVGAAICDVGAVEVLLNEYPWLFADGFESGTTSAWE
jgi:hypothetical protein